MVSRADGMPDIHVCDYSLVHHRRKSINSAIREIKALCLFHEWLDDQRIDLNERIDSGSLFTPAEIEILSEKMRLSKRPPKLIGRQEVQRVVVGNTHSDRLNWAYDYIKWRASHIIPRMSDPVRAIATRSRLLEINDQISGFTRSSNQRQREALTDEQYNFLLEVCRPDDPRNPFMPQTRHRNFAIVLLIAELGVREGEPLVLKGPHLKLSGAHPEIVIEPNPDDPDDFRRRPPLVKTSGRTLLTSNALARVLDIYIGKHRSEMKSAKKTPFIFLDTKGDGNPMSLEAVYGIFTVLRDRFPDDLPADLSAHLLRHTWNARFRRQASALGWNDAFRDVVNNYLMGWAKNSKQSVKYGHSEIVREASRVLLQMQATLLDVAA